MRNKTATDALVRWVVLTLAGTGLIVLFPPEVFGGPSSVAHAAPFVALAPILGFLVMTAGWVVFLVHITHVDSRWHEDAAALALLSAATVAGIAAVAGILAGPLLALLVPLAASVGLHTALAVRIDRGCGRTRPPFGLPSASVVP